MGSGIRVTVDNMNLEQIAESGQCFRWKKIENDKYVIPGLRLENRDLEDITIIQKGNCFEVSCNENDWNSHWTNYFDLDTDYGQIGRNILASSDKHAIEAFNCGSGIRILRQDVWEMIVTFLISQNNNIKRITNSVEAICSRNNGHFPKPGEIDSDIFMDKTLGLGYRSPYLKEIYDFAETNPDWVSELKNLNYDQAMESLKERNGIGPKVANCICLFGLHHVDAFPIDTHIKQLLAKYYPYGFNFDYYKGYAGIVQQYLFYYELMH